MIYLDGTEHTKEGIATCMANFFEAMGNNKPEDKHLFDDDFYNKTNNQLEQITKTNKHIDLFNLDLNADFTIIEVVYQQFYCI